MKKELREKVWHKYNNHCAYCGKVLEYEDMQVDHLIPKGRRSYFDPIQENKIIESFNNLMPSCRRCNHYKRAYSLKEFRQLMVSLHDRVARQYITKVAIDYGIVEIKPFDGVFFFERPTVTVTGEIIVDNLTTT